MGDILIREMKIASRMRALALLFLALLALACRHSTPPAPCARRSTSEGTDPQGARPLYDAIQSCCADTEIARRSRQVNAITNIPDACPADPRPVRKEE